MLAQLHDYHFYIDSLSSFYANNTMILDYRLDNHDFFSAFFKMVHLDVDSLLDLFPPFYSLTGRPAVYQIEMLRSLILMTHFRYVSIKKWVAKLNNDKCLAALCGFNPSHIPQVSSYYDFFSRFWNEDEKSHLLPSGLNSKPAGKKPKKNQKLVNHSSSITRDIVDSYANSYVPSSPEDFLLTIFDKLAVNFSIQKSILDTSSTLSGDGSAIKTHANPYGSSTNDENYRFYSDIDANFGWDSDLNVYYYGYSAYSISANIPKFNIDLPVFLTLAKASQHDAITSLTALAKFKSINSTLYPKYYCLDSASDNYPTHEFAYSLGMIPLIDINKRNTGNNVYEPYTDISENGRPICIGGKEMVPDGRDYKRYRHKFRCPYHSCKDNPCPHKDKCSKSPYGRVIYIKFDTDIKLFGPVPYKSDKWKTIYKNRTSCERINNRIINDYHFLDSRMHGRKRNMFLLLLIGINIHLDAYKKATRL